MGILAKLFGQEKKEPVTALQAAVPQRNPRKTVKRKPKLTAEADRDSAIALIKAAIRSSGYKVISVRNLLSLFGYQKRSTENIKRITARLDEHNLTIYPKLDLTLKPTEALRIYSFPVVQLGDLFSSPALAATGLPKPLKQQRERELEEYIKQHEHFRQLGLSNAKRQHSPIHTRDRFDFLCEDEQGNLVVLELKHRGGGKSAVEQVLRYIGMLKQEFPTKPTRGILVTGIQDMDTAKALHGMTPDQQQQIDWYLYCFDKSTGSLRFEPVEYDFISHRLALAHSL